MGYNFDLQRVNIMSDPNLINLLNAKFDEIGKQLAHNTNTLIRMEKEMSSQITSNTLEIVAVKKVAAATSTTVEANTEDIAKLKDENKVLKDDNTRMADELKKQGDAFCKVSLSHLDYQRKRCIK